MKRILKMKLHWQILIAMIIGTIIGVIFQSIYHGKPEGAVYSVLVSMGTIFIRLLRMVIVPLVLTSIITGVASLGSGKSIGRLGGKTLLYYMATSMIAVMIGLFFANVLQPGVGANIPVGETVDTSALQTPDSPAEILIRMIPTNPVEAMATGDMLGIIFFAIILGFGITRLKPDHKETLQKFFNAGFEVMMEITEFVIKFAPIGVLGLIVRAVSITGFNLYGDLFLYITTLTVGLSLHLWVVLPLIFYLFTRINPLLHLKAMASAMVTAFSTSSSNATLPVTMECVEKNVGVSNKTSSFVLPLGATINMDGTALYECVGVIFISQVLGVELTFAQQFIIVLTALLASIGAAGIPSAGLVVIFIVTAAVGFKDVDVAVIIGTMLAVDRPLDMYRTMINIVSDSVGTVIVAKSEGETGFYEAMKKD
ncbi:MAG: dicarboxylate/amino acid:cation symporter [bacterium]|nr:dicarboxylate/amino acid:cation symporter [bacterium]